MIIFAQVSVPGRQLPERARACFSSRIEKLKMVIDACMLRSCWMDNVSEIYQHYFAGSIVRILQTTRSESVDVAVEFAEIQLVATSSANMLVETQDPDIAMGNLEITGFIRQQYLKPFISYDRLHQKYGVAFEKATNCQICSKKFLSLIRPMQNCRFCGRAVCNACRSRTYFKRLAS